MIRLSQNTHAGALIGLLLGMTQGTLSLSLYPWLPTTGLLDQLGFLAALAAGWLIPGALLGTLAGHSSRPALVFGLPVAAAGVVFFGGILTRYDRSLLSLTALAAGGVAIIAALVLGSMFSWLRSRQVPQLTVPVLASTLLLSTAVGVTRAPLPPPDSPEAPAQVAESLPRTPGVLLITVDTLRADHLSPYGYARQTSPNLQRLAERGVLFEAAITQKTHTAPATASLMTGLYPHQHGLIANNSILPPEQLTLAEHLASAGWATAAVVSNGWLTEVFGFNQGFSDFSAHPITDREEMRQEAAAVNSRALSWLEQHDGTPFFLWLHYVDPHGPYIVPEAYESLFFDDPLAANLSGTAIVEGFGRGRVMPEMVLDGIDDMSGYVSRYDAEIRYLDDQLGELLSSPALPEDTLIILTADHGESLHDHGYTCFHGESTFEEEARVPLIVAHPALPGGARIPEPVELIDIPATITELLGIEPMPTSGQSLTPRLLHPTIPPMQDGIAFTEGRYRLGYATRCVRSSSWKLIYEPLELSAPLDALLERQWALWSGASPNPYTCRIYDRQLYNLQEDPGESVNVFADSPEAARAHDALLRAHVTTTIPTSVPSQPPAVVDADTLENLKALGYIH